MEWAFMHLPKTGGTSVRAALGPDFAHVGRFKEPHIDVAAAAAHFGQRWDDAFTFGFVRNPWDRIVSLFHHRNRGLRERSQRDVHKVFRDFMLAKTENLTQLHRPKPAWLALGDGERILVDFVGRFEHLRQDFQHVCSALDVKHKLPRRNVSQRAEDWRPYYDDATAAFVEQFYACDVEHFGYGFDDYAG